MTRLWEAFTSQLLLIARKHEFRFNILLMARRLYKTVVRVKKRYKY